MLIKQLYSIKADDFTALIEIPSGKFFSFRLSPARKLTENDLSPVGLSVEPHVYLSSVGASPYEGAIEAMQMRSFGLTKSIISHIRQCRGITQKELAFRSGVNIRQIQKIESGDIEPGNITAKNFMAIADALEVDPHSLL